MPTEEPALSGQTVGEHWAVVVLHLCLGPPRSETPGALDFTEVTSSVCRTENFISVACEDGSAQGGAGYFYLSLGDGAMAHPVLAVFLINDGDRNWASRPLHRGCPPQGEGVGEERW